MLTIADRRRLALYYIKLAKEVQWSYEKNAWGLKHWRYLSAASIIIMPFCHTVLRPFAMLINAITKRMVIEESREKPSLSDRIRFRLGKMSEDEASRYRWSCRWKNKSRTKSIINA